MANKETTSRVIQVGKDVKKIAWLSMLESISIIIAGVLFVAWPEEMKTIIAYIVGVLLILKGSYQIIEYFVEKGHKDFFNNDLLFGIVSLLVGIAVIAMGDNIANVFRIIVGIYMIYDSLLRINISIKLANAKIGAWKYILVLALIILVLGVFVTFNDVATVIGWMLVGAGVVGIMSDILFICKVNDVVEALTA
jgi:uncharacterized membrane protein HdeD (DUF308 family)